jgi:hypothetical protein
VEIRYVLRRTGEAQSATIVAGGPA